MSKSAIIALPSVGGFCKGFPSRLVSVYGHGISKGWKLGVMEADYVPHDCCRNHIVAGFLETDAEWLLMIDSDTIPPVNILDMLENAEGKMSIVSADVRTMSKDGPKPTARRIDPEDNKWKAIDVPAEECIEVDGVGTACLAIHRTVLEEMKKAEGFRGWFRFEYNDTGFRRIGEDYYFCLKAIDKDFKIGYDTRYVCQHSKTTLLIGDTVWPNLNTVIAEN